MARPYKARRICQLPTVAVFEPAEGNAKREVELSLEEYEAIRLIDLLGCTQEECALQMGVARTTVQSVYTSARKKTAQCLVYGWRLCIRGGNYQVCPKGAGCCRNQSRGRLCMGADRAAEERKQEGITMKIAVTYENGQIFQHFGHTEEFKIYQTEGQEILSSQTVGTGGSGHGALAGFLKSQGVEALICGGIGGGARAALAEAGIRLYPGASGDADQAVKNLLAGTLDYDPDTQCSHHQGEDHDCHHGGDDHHCGHHDGGHGCGVH